MILDKTAKLYDCMNFASAPNDLSTIYRTACAATV